MATSPVSLTPSDFDVTKVTFGDKPLGSSDSSRPSNVSIRYDNNYVWRIKGAAGWPLKEHPVTKDPNGTYYADLPNNCPFGVSKEMNKDGKITSIEPKIDMVLRGNQLPLVQAIEKLEEKVFDHMVETFKQFKSKDYETLKKKLKREPSTDDIRSAITQYSTIKPSRRRNPDTNEYTEDPDAKILSIKIRAPSNNAEVAADDKAKNKYTQIKMAKLDTHGFVMDKSHDTVVDLASLQHGSFKGCYLSVILQPSAYWFNQTGSGLKLFAAAIRVIPRYLKNGPVDEEFDFDDIPVCRTVEEAPVEAPSEEIVKPMETLHVEEPNAVVAQKVDEIEESDDDESSDDSSSDGSDDQ